MKKRPKSNQLKLVPAPVPGQDEITTLYQTYNETLVRYLTIRLRSEQDAIDVAQEAYIRLMKRENLIEIGCKQSFLFRTATNISIDLQRQRTRQAKNFANSKMLFAATDEITPERSFTARQSLAALQKTVEALPPKCRRAFILYKFKHMTIEEVAQKMDLSTSSIRKYVTQALALCMAEFDQ